MNIYEQADKELAELLGWTFQDYQLDGNYVWYNAIADQVNPPHWTLDDGECFRLAVEYEIDVLKLIYGHDWLLMNDMADTKDRLSAVRYAIVQSVISKLKG